MKKFLARIAPLAAAVPLMAVAPVGATPLNYFTDFDSQQPELIYEVYEGGGHAVGQACGTDACTSFATQGQRTYGRFAITPSATPGFYQNAAASHVATPGEANMGPYNVSYGHPITMETKVRWSANYDLYGQSGAQGTSGIILWNGAIGPQGQTPDYAQLGFMWTSQDVLGGFLAGFTANSYVDLTPVGVSYPAAPIDIHEWIKLKLVWSQDAQGVQSVKYYADGQYLGEHVLPAPLHGLSLEIWNDNQEPNFCEEGLCNNFPNPTEQQNFDVDYVKINQS